MIKTVSCLIIDIIICFIIYLKNFVPRTLRMLTEFVNFKIRISTFENLLHKSDTGVYIEMNLSHFESCHGLIN